MHWRTHLIKNSQLVAGSGFTFAIASYYFYFHQKYIDYKFWHNFGNAGNDFSVHLEKIKREFAEVQTDISQATKRENFNVVMQLKDGPKNCILFVNKSSHLPIHLKSAKYSAIGIPTYFFNVDLDEIKIDNLKLGGKSGHPFAPDSIEQLRLRKTLLLTKDAIKFVIGRELAYLYGPHYMSSRGFDFWSNIGNVCASYVAYQASYLLGNLSRFLIAPISLRFIVNSMILGAVLSFKVQLFDMFKRSMDSQADITASRLDVRYRPGAIEYYDKIIRLNQIIYQIGSLKHPEKVKSHVNGVTKLGNEQNSLFGVFGMTSFERMSNAIIPKND